MITDAKLLIVPTRNLTDFARKENRKQALLQYNKTRISIGHQHGRRLGLKDVLRVLLSLLRHDLHGH
jgi:hypothetical protein